MLSGEATDTVLSIILALTQGRTEFSLLAEFLNTIDEIRVMFKTLGAFANVNYCKTFTEDLSLVSLLCEKELNKEAYCRTLQGKGFTPEQCEDILAEQLENDQQKMITLSEILTAESISDYFQNQVGPAACTPDSPGLLPPNNDFLDQIVSNALDSTIGMVDADDRLRFKKLCSWHPGHGEKCKHSGFAPIRGRRRRASCSSMA